MPLYEYRCTACEHQFEVLQSFSDKPVRKCVKCGCKVEKLVSRSGFVLKGGGWYKSDYGGSGKSASASKAGEASTGTGTGGASEAPADSGGGSEKAPKSGESSPAPAKPAASGGT